VMEGGVLRYSGTAAELKAQPDLLHSAYLLRGAAAAGGPADLLRDAASADGPATDAGTGASEAQ